MAPSHPRRHRDHRSRYHHPRTSLPPPLIKLDSLPAIPDWRPPFKVDSINGLVLSDDSTETLLAAEIIESEGLYLIPVKKEVSDCPPIAVNSAVN